MARSRHSASPDTRPWKVIFLEALGESPNVAAAARVAGISRRQAYREKLTDQEFSDDWEDIQQASLDKVEETAFKRAYNPRDPGGTTLICFLLKAHRKDVYGDRVKVDASLNPTGDELALSMREYLGR